MRQEKATSFFGKILGKKVWKERWAELRASKLTIYSSRSEQKELDQISITQASTVDEAAVAVFKRSFCFTVVGRGGGGQSCFGCNSSKERDAWLQALRAAIASADGGQ
jgi:catechol 2,3-dioxygenase-like lactoylglutathione lyase family enzyme